MNCPRCGIECEDTARACFSCGCILSQADGSFTPRLSKLAVASLVLGVLSVFTFFLPLLPALIIGILAISRIRKSRGTLVGERAAMAGIIIPLLSLPVLLAILWTLWWQDAGPVPNEFTEADLASVRPENLSSWQVLSRLNDQPDDPKGAPAIGLSKDDLALISSIWKEMQNFDPAPPPFEFLSRHRMDIQRLWNQSERGRQIIKELNGYDEIADLTRPFLDEEMRYSYNVKQMHEIYSLHSLMLLNENKDMEACRELIEYDSVVRRHCGFARAMVTKLLCFYILAEDLKMAGLLANHPNLSEETLRLLSSRFERLSPSQVSLENSFIHEYLLFKNMIESSEFNKSHLCKINSISRYFDAVIRNMILRDDGQAVNEYCQNSVWPWEIPVPKAPLDLSFMDDNHWDVYSIYNPGGIMLMGIFIPAYGLSLHHNDELLIADDLFQWILARRLGHEGSLKARAYSDEYMVDLEKEIIFSVGPDGQPYTKDDIKLQINPEVLGLK